MALGASNTVLCSATLPFDASLEQRLAAANAGGFDGLSMWARDVVRARASGHRDADIRAMFADHGVEVAELEPVWSWRTDLGGATSKSQDPAGILRFDVDELLLVADAIGARAINAVDVLKSGGSIEQTAEAFAGICDRAAEHGVWVLVEFLPWSHVADVSTASEVVRTAGRPNGGIMLDSWHFFRGAADFAALRAVPGDLIVGTQLSDAPREPAADMMTENLQGRLLFGDGDQDLVRLFRTLDEISAVAPLGVEVISTELGRMDPVEVGRRSGDALRAALDETRRRSQP